MSHLAFWLLASLTSLAPGLATAGNLDPRRSIEAELPHIEKILPLQPLLESEVLIEDFQATFLSNGSVKLSGSGQARTGAPASAIEYEVDLIHGTYRARQVEAQEVAGSLLRSDDISFLEKGSEDEPRAEKAVRPGNRAMTVKVQTRDPILLASTETTMTLDWNTALDGGVHMNQWSYSCKTADPSTSDAPWLNRSCQRGRARSSSTQVCQDLRASYHNDESSVSQSLSICGRNDAKLTYRWSHTDSRDWTGLISGWIIVG